MHCAQLKFAPFIMYIYIEHPRTLINSSYALVFIAILLAGETGYARTVYKIFTRPDPRVTGPVGFAQR